MAKKITQAKNKTTEPSLAYVASTYLFRCTVPATLFSSPLLCHNASLLTVIYFKLQSPQWALFVKIHIETVTENLTVTVICLSINYIKISNCLKHEIYHLGTTKFTNTVLQLVLNIFKWIDIQIIIIKRGAKYYSKSILNVTDWCTYCVK